MISAFSESEACWSQDDSVVPDGYTAIICEHLVGVRDRYLWDVYVKEHDGSQTCGMRPAELHTLDDTDDSVSVIASSRRRPSSLGQLSKLRFQKIVAPADWWTILSGPVSDEIVDLPAEADLSSSLCTQLNPV